MFAEVCVENITQIDNLAVVMETSSGDTLSEGKWEVGALPTTMPELASDLEGLPSLKVKFSSFVKLTYIIISGQVDSGSTLELAIKAKYYSGSNATLISDDENLRILTFKLNGRLNLPLEQEVDEVEIVPLRYNGSTNTLPRVKVEFFGCAEIGLWQFYLCLVVSENKVSLKEAMY